MRPAVKTDWEGASPGEALAQRLHEAEIAKAFNRRQAEVWAMDPPEFDGRRLVTFTCASGYRAREFARQLVGAVGSEPYDLGGLKHARRIEALAGGVIELPFAGNDPHTVLNPTITNSPFPILIPTYQSVGLESP